MDHNDDLSIKTIVDEKYFNDEKLVILSRKKSRNKMKKLP